MDKHKDQKCPVCEDTYRTQGTAQSTEFVVSHMPQDSTENELVEGEGIDGAANIGTANDRVCFQLNDRRVPQTTVDYYVH